jgi:hypothetical protein
VELTLARTVAESTALLATFEEIGRQEPPPLAPMNKSCSQFK